MAQQESVLGKRKSVAPAGQYTCTYSDETKSDDIYWISWSDEPGKAAIWLAHKWTNVFDSWAPTLSLSNSCLHPTSRTVKMLEKTVFDIAYRHIEPHFPDEIAEIAASYVGPLPPWFIKIVDAIGDLVREKPNPKPTYPRSIGVFSRPPGPVVYYTTLAPDRLVYPDGTGIPIPEIAGMNVLFKVFALQLVCDYANVKMFIYMTEHA